MTYKISVDAFEGPLDVLLNLIHKSEIDIYDIPINIVTQQFLDYIDKMEELNLEITSEFLVMAATLLEIKSKMLLPKEKIVEDGIEIEIDPRDDLVQKLLEYKLYKEVAEKLKISELMESKVYYKPREDLSIYDDKLEELGKLDLNQLVKAISKIMARSIRENESINFSEIHREEYTLEACIEEIGFMLTKSKKIRFSELLSLETTKEEIITYFLSLLELIRLKNVYVQQDQNLGDLIIIRRMEEEEYGQ